MVAIVSGTDFPLMVSRRLVDWVDRAERSYQEAFDAALAFAREALPRAVAQFGSIESVVIVHFDSVMIIGLDAKSKSFCVFAFHVVAHDPCPPDGPGSAMWNGLLATEFAERLGLNFCIDRKMITFVAKSTGLLSEIRANMTSTNAAKNTDWTNHGLKFDGNFCPIIKLNEGKTAPPLQAFDETALLETIIQTQAFRRSMTDDTHAVDEAWAGLAATCVREELFALPLGAQPRNS